MLRSQNLAGNLHMLRAPIMLHVKARSFLNNLSYLNSPVELSKKFKHLIKYNETLDCLISKHII